MIGKTILHYRIIEELGRGGMGVVYKAGDTRLDREVAIKFLPRQVAANAEERQRFVIEAKAAAALNHPNIATIYAIEEVNDEMFIVMEYIQGRELREAVDGGALAVEQVVDVATQVAQGLQAAHAKGIIHRDIKSSNIMIAEDGTVKIMDFGLAKIRSAAWQTRAGTTMGTYASMSPEQLRALPVDHRCDIWALGVLLYEMLTGKAPFTGHYEQELVFAILNETPPPPTSLCPELPPQVDALSARMLAKNPDARFSDLKLVIAELHTLQELIREEGEPVVREKVPAPKGPPEQIGPYKIVQKLGEGGMGEVFLAEQLAPVRRRVALKIIKKGMDSKEVVARFEAERQALAVMDHPNIAKVFEAGTTDRGRPYFVMEYVPGIPLNEFCDRQRLTPEARLRLFIDICSAVQHAHQKGVIHRDLKPSNILVTEPIKSRQEGVPQRLVPKIIDFGIAKAIHTPLTDRTLVTIAGEAMGTPAYMSPEQLDGGRMDIDTRADIYSLGVILYEMLTGVLPFRMEDYQNPGGAFRQRLLETDPPTPSKRLSTLGEQREKVARDRGLGWQELLKRLRGDLNWIVMKAMEKERARRYETVNELAMDIRRYLNDEPVSARPPSTTYRLHKFIRRNRAGVVAAGVALIGLLLGLIFATLGLIRAMQAERQARTEAETARQVSDFMVDLFKISDPSETQGDTISVRTFLDRSAAHIGGELQDQPVIQSRLMQTMGRVYANLGLFQKGIALLDSARIRQETVLGATHPELAQTLWRLGYAWYETGDNEKALNFLNRALVIQRQNKNELGELQVLNSLVDVWDQKAEYDTAMSLARQAVRIADRYPDAKDVSLPRAYLRVAKVSMHQGNYNEAIPLARRGLQQVLRHHSEYHPASQEIMNDLAVVLENANHYQEALSLHQKVVEIAEKTWGKEHWQTAISYDNIANVLNQLGRHDEALDYQHKAEALLRKNYGNDHVDLGINLNNQAHTLLKKGDYAAAEAPIREANRIMIANFGENHPYVGVTYYTMAGILMNQGKLATAKAMNEKSVAILKQTLGEAHPRHAIALRQLGIIEAKQKNYSDAEQHFRKAIAIFRKGQPVDSVALADAKKNYADMLKKLGRDTEAEQLLSSDE